MRPVTTFVRPLAEDEKQRLKAELRSRDAFTLRRAQITTLGLATGTTMAPLYARLVAATRTGSVSFRTAFSFNLDEYVGVAPEAPGSFHAFMREHLFRFIDIEPARGIDGEGDDRCPGRLPAGRPHPLRR